MPALSAYFVPVDVVLGSLNAPPELLQVAESLLGPSRSQRADDRS
ncbi:MAG TPA: hypothetical protein VER33_25535 [Polyangiaceae bacterium]|nr:hypothetical protein [Polyangiaceae bacterium]